MPAGGKNCLLQQKNKQWVGRRMNLWKHFKTITKHKLLVMEGCFKVGLIRQGLAHDLSKYTPVEFLNGVKYFQGTRSPISAEREEKGYSEAWMHHKGRNKHHYEYWHDMNLETKQYEPLPMPRKYLAEMIMDRRAASMTYKGKDYNDSFPLEYQLNSKDRALMHPQTRKELEFLLTMLRDKGEQETFRYIRAVVLKNRPFPWENEISKSRAAKRNSSDRE